MSREWRLYFDDLVEACPRIVAYSSGMSREQFETSTLHYDATVRNIELLGEAAKNIPEDIRAGMAKIPWRELIAIRNVVAHGYFGINNDILWDIVSRKAPELLIRLQAYRSAGD
jgi:uncharacterized protein with HEPN domain